MKTTTTILERAVNIAIIVILLLPIAVIVTGCGDNEDPLDPTTDIAKDTATGVFAEAKHNDTALAAPSAPQGTPRVTEVGFYHDWKLTKQVVGPVAPKEKIFIKIVFSEPMKHVVSDGKEARPVIYHRANKGDLVQFKMAAHGAGGEDFVFGDAKPFGGGTDDYVCKYKVPAEGKIAIMVGKYSVDLQDNKLAKFYTHPVNLEVKQSGLQNEQVDQNNNIPVEVVGVSYYADKNCTEPLVGSVMERATIYTKIVFSKAVPVVVADDESARPRIFYNPDGGWDAETQYRIKQRNTNLQDGEAKLFRNTNHSIVCRGKAAWVRVGYITAFTTRVNNREFSDNDLEVTIRPASSLFSDKEYSAPVGGSGDFIGQVRMPSSGRKMEHSKPVPDATVTIVSGPQSGKRAITDRGGYYHFRDVRGNELHVQVEREHFESKEAIVHRHRATTLPDRVPIFYHQDVQNIPGTILIGMRWPDEVRFILEEVYLDPDVLCVLDTRERAREIGAPGSAVYGSGLVEIYGSGHGTGSLAHELAHAHQAAVSRLYGFYNTFNGGFNWRKTPEGKAYIKAMYKDFKEVGRMEGDNVPGYDHNTPVENAADVCSRYWIVDSFSIDGGLKVNAPNRYRWCQEWLHRQYD